MKSNKLNQTALAWKDASQQQLHHIQSFRWNSFEEEKNKDNNNNKVYTHLDETTLVTTYKATRNFIPKHYNNTILNHYRACLSTVELRNKWCPWLKDILTIEAFDSNMTSVQGTMVDMDHVEHKAIWFEQATGTKQSVQFIAASLAMDFFLAVEIEDAHAATTVRATIYLQGMEPTLSVALTRLIQLEPYPWISHCDEAIAVQRLYYHDDGKCDIEYVYQPQDASQLPHAAVDIRQKTNHPSRWPTGSWENKFLTSSSLLFSSSSANASPQLQPMTANASCPDKHPNNMMLPWLGGGEDDDKEEHASTYKLDKDELRIQVSDIPHITITLPERLAWSDTFAQLCVRCYRRRSPRQHHDSYVIQIIHPQRMRQYFIQEEEAMRLDDEDQDMDPLRVDVVVSKSDNQKLIVNKNEWPIRSWAFASSDDDEEEEEEEVEEEGQDDIFVDGMEELVHESNHVIEHTMPTIPSSSTWIHTVPDLYKQDKEETVHNNTVASPMMQPLEKKTDMTIEENKPTTDAASSTIITPEYQPPHAKEEDLDDEYRSFENKLPVGDPAALQKMYPQFSEYLQPSVAATVVQSPSKENGHVMIKKIDIANHPLGGFLSESTWKDGSVWDIKAVLESTGARKIWDTTYESSTYLHALTPTSSLWHTKMKGAWPVSPRDYVCFHGQYVSPYRIDLLATSCFGDSFQYKPLPQQSVPGYARATMDVMGWRLEHVDDTTVSVKQVLVTQFPTWVIHYMTSRLLVQTCTAVQSARAYFESFGAPPSLEHLTCAQLVNVKHDHERKNWRCEYTRRLDASEKDGQDSAVANQNTATATATTTTTTTATATATTTTATATTTAAVVTTAAATLDSSHVNTTNSAQSTISIVRLDKRRWATNNKYAVVIDPPPSRVSALQKVCDPYGVWLTVEHDEAFIIPLRGKILVLIKSDELAVGNTCTAVAPEQQQKNECTLNVNGNEIIIEKDERKPFLSMPNNRIKQTLFSQKGLKQKERGSPPDATKLPPPPPAPAPAPATTTAATTTTTTAPSPAPAPAVVVDKGKSSTNAVTEEAKIHQALNQLPISPKEHAQAAMSFLKLTDEQFGWTVLSNNNKSGIRISKKPGVKNPTATAVSQKADDSNIVDKTNTSPFFQVFDPYMVYKGSKVIENFSVDEVRSVVTDIGHIRAVYDDTIEPKTDVIRQQDDDASSGCRVIRQSVKALFPFKNREIYAVSCLAQEELTSTSQSSNTNTKRTLYVESSLPDFPLIHPKKTRGHVFMSGWILEPIDPYNTTTANHPIPSTRVIYVAALDLGTSVPSYISNLVANNWFPKKIQAVESYLRSRGPPPVVTQPFPLLVFSNNTLSKAVHQENNATWTCMHSSYDEKHHFKLTHRLQLWKKTRLEDVQPTASSSASLVPPFRRPSHHTLTSETRRGSLPTNTLPKKRLVPTATTTAPPVPTTSSSSSTTTSTAAKTDAVTYRALTCLQTTFDLRPYNKGYEIQAQLYQRKHDDDNNNNNNNQQRKNVSDKLELSISEPPSLSNVVLEGSTKSIKKHTVTITAQGLSAAMHVVYELEFSLMPARLEIPFNKRATQLTVSHVLGEDPIVADDGSGGGGVVLVNGIEASVPLDNIKLKALHQQEENLQSNNTNDNNTSGNTSGGGSPNAASPVKETTAPVLQDGGGITAFDVQRNHPPFLVDKVLAFPEEESTTTTTTTIAAAHSMDGGVVATALGNVSAGVNNFGARMMNPFRAASHSYLLANTELVNQDVPSSSEDEGDGRQEKSNAINATIMALHEIRLLRKSSDTMRKGMFLLLICLVLAVVFALLMLQPMLERHDASFTASSTVASLRQSIEKGVVRRLLQIPWFGGWNIQLIAVRRD